MTHTHEVGPASPMYLAPQNDRFSRFMIRLWERSPKWSAPMVALVCFLGGVAYTLAIHPTSGDAASSPTCLVKMTTGFDGPGCGGTRAFYYLLHGDIPAAARNHILAVFAAPYLVYMFIAWAGTVAFGWKLPMLRITPKTISIFLAVWGVFAVLRNLPWAPFTWFYV